MGRRNQRGNPILALLAILLALIGFFGPIIIALWALISELSARKFGGAKAVADLITPAEQSQVAVLEQRVHNLQSQKNKVYSDGQAAGFSLRVDGDLFDARSPGARLLNADLNQLSFAQATAYRDLAGVRSILETRINDWLSARSGLVAARVTLLVFIGVFVFVSLATQESGSERTLEQVLLGADQDNSEMLVSSLIATLSAGLVGFITQKVARASLAA